MTVAQAPFRGTCIVGHRGAGRTGATPGTVENTLASFLRAVDDGASWVETDCRVTLDGRLVLAHDVAVAAGQVGLLTFDEALRAGAVDANVLDLLPAHVGVDLEVKTSLLDVRSAGTHAVAAQFVGERVGQRPWLLSSFDPSAKVAADTAGVPFGMLFEREAWFYESVTIAARMGAQVVISHERSVHHWQAGHPSVFDCLAAARASGMQVMVWGATERSWVAAADFALDAVCVDDVSGAVRGIAVSRAFV